MERLRAESTQSLLQLILLLGRGLVGLRGLGGGRGGLVEFLAELDAGVVGELAKEFVDGVLADLGGGGLADGVLVDAVGHGVVFVLLLELFEGDEGLRRKLISGHPCLYLLRGANKK